MVKNQVLNSKFKDTKLSCEQCVLRFFSPEAFGSEEWAELVCHFSLADT